MKEWLIEHTECPLCKTPVLDSEALRQERMAAGIEEGGSSRHVLFPDPVVELPREPVGALGEPAVIHVGESNSVTSPETQEAPAQAPARL